MRRPVPLRHRGTSNARATRGLADQKVGLPDGSPPTSTSRIVNGGLKEKSESGKQNLIHSFSLERVGDFLAKTRSVAVTTSLLGVLVLLLLYALLAAWLTVTDRNIVLERVVVGEDLRKQGITPELVVSRIRSRVTQVYTKSNSRFENVADTSERSRLSDIPDLELPGEAGKLPLQELLKNLRPTTNNAAVEVISVGNVIRLRVVGLVDLADGRATVIEGTGKLPILAGNERRNPPHSLTLASYQKALDKAVAPVGEEIVKLRAPYTLASFYQERGDEHSALQTAALAASSGSKSQKSVAFNLWGLLLMDRGDLSMAEAMFNKSILLDVRNSYPIVNKALTLSKRAKRIRAKDPAGARKLWDSANLLYAQAEQRVLESGRPNMVLHLNWGTTMEYLGQYDDRYYEQAVRQYQSQMSISMNDPDIYISLGDARRKWAESCRAKNAHAHAVDLERNAILNYRTAIDMRPNDYLPYLSIGQIYATKGRTRDAKRMYLLALLRDRGNEEILSNVAQVYGAKTVQRLRSVSSKTSSQKEGWKAAYKAILLR